MNTFVIDFEHTRVLAEELDRAAHELTGPALPASVAPGPHTHPGLDAAREDFEQALAQAVGAVDARSQALAQRVSELAESGRDLATGAETTEATLTRRLDGVSP